MNLVASFEVKEGTEIIAVAFDADNGSVVKTVEIANETPVTPPPDPQKSGYKFKGWYKEDTKFDFSTNITESIVLKAKWIKDKSDKTESMVDGKGFNIDSGKIEYNLGAAGTEYYSNGEFYAPAIKLETKSKLIFNKNGHKTVFYRQPDYPKHIDAPHETIVKAINGYYWYLDGYNYAYIRPEVVDWYGHKALIWEAYMLGLKNSKITPFENYSNDEYNNANAAGCGSDLCNLLQANPLKFANDLISKYDIKVSGNKLNMTVGGKKYTFTKHTSAKKIYGTFSVDKEKIEVTTGETVTINADIQPYFSNYYLTAHSSDENIVSGSERPASSSVGKDNFEFRTHKPGNATITIKERESGKSKTIEVTVKPVYVSGIKISKNTLTLQKRNSEKLYASVVPSNANTKGVTWSTSNPSVVTVTADGTVKGVGFGTAIITATTKEGGYTASCEVTVTQAPFSVSASVGTYWPTAGTGISAEAKASGGSEEYVYFYIKVYHNEQLIGEINDRKIYISAPVLLKGTYKAEAYVKDSDGHEGYDESIITIG